MIELDRTFASMVILKDSSIAMKSPPLTELAVPRARKGVKELPKVKSCKSVKVLVAEVAAEAVLSCQMTDNGFAEE